MPTTPEKTLPLHLCWRPPLCCEEFYGRNIDQMPNLLEEGRTPLSIADLMRRRLEVLDAAQDVKDAWWSNYFDSGDAIFYHPNGEAKIVLAAEPMRTLTPASKLKEGALVISDPEYLALDGQTFTTNELKTYTGKSFTPTSVKNNPIWKTLSGDDQHLLNEYTDAVFAALKEQLTGTRT